MTLPNGTHHSEPDVGPDRAVPDTSGNDPPAERLHLDAPTLDEAAMADDFDAVTDAPLGRAGVNRALAND